MPRMTHPDSSRSIEVSPSQVPTYESQGWSVERPVKKSTTPTTATPAKDKE